MSSNVKPGTLAFLVSLVGRTEQSRHPVHNGNEVGLCPYSNGEPLSRASRRPIIIRKEYGKHRTFRKMWLSDMTTYPIVVVLGFAIALCTGVGVTGLMCNPDVRVDPSKRNTIIRTWGIE
eukprot:scaffold4033_cov57-Attheya_sp.AAC.3